MVHIGLLRGC
jgi:hypothetical protein